MTSAVHPHFAEHGTFEGMPLGRLPMKPQPKLLRLSSYLLGAAELPEPPASFDLVSDVASWPMYDNDRLGDCTCAAAGHMVQAWTAANKVEHVPDPSLVDLFYWETGDPPASTGTAGGPTDTGRVETDVLNYWRRHALGTSPITAYVAVDPKNGSRVLDGIYLFGGLYLGVALPVTAQRQQVWDVVDPSLRGDSAPGSWGGHAVPALAYVGTDRGVEYTVVTWGGLMPVTGAFFSAYVEEAYAVLSPDWLGSEDGAPNGFNLDALKADLEAL